MHDIYVVLLLLGSSRAVEISEGTWPCCGLAYRGGYGEQWSRAQCFGCRENIWARVIAKQLKNSSFILEPIFFLLIPTIITFLYSFLPRQLYVLSVFTFILPLLLVLDYNGSYLLRVFKNSSVCFSLLA